MRRWGLALLALAGAVWLSFVLTPWPGVMIIRAIFDRGAAAASARLDPHVPAGVGTLTLPYDPADADAVLDIYRLPGPQAGPLVLWVHGGGFVSGRRQDVANYLKVMAGRGVTVVNLDYTIAPGATYPGPLRQVQQALAFLQREGAALGLDPGRIVLAGDSAGAQIAAQSAALVTNPELARRLQIAPGAPPTALAGALLFCGVYDLQALGSGGGVMGWFVNTAGWAYAGRRDWRAAGTLASASVIGALTPAFPPAFVSAGNGDPLAPQSQALAGALAAQGGRVETLFFPASLSPALGHEYQFDLDRPEGRQALDRALDWLAAL